MRRKTPKKTYKPKTSNLKPFSYHLGNFLIIISLFIFAFTVLPIVSVYLFPPKITAVEKLKGDYVTIPKISAQAPLFFNVDLHFGVETWIKKGVIVCASAEKEAQIVINTFLNLTEGNPEARTKAKKALLRFL